MTRLIGDVFEFIRNGMSIKQSKEFDGLPITRIETIWNSKIDLERVGYAGVAIENSKDFLLKDGDILFSHINSVAHIGKCAIYSDKYGQLIHGMNLLCFRPNTAIILPNYALYTLRSNQFRNQLAKSIKKAVNQASVSIGDIKNIKVEIPDFSQQKKIASILDKVEKIEGEYEVSKQKIDSLKLSLMNKFFNQQ